MAEIKVEGDLKLVEKIVTACGEHLGPMSTYKLGVAAVSCSVVVATFKKMILEDERVERIEIQDGKH
jgi:hypothetical protein